MSFIRLAWVNLNRLRTDVGRFRSSLHKWGLASSTTCRFSADDQAADYVFLYNNIHPAQPG